MFLKSHNRILSVLLGIAILVVFQSCEQREHANLLDPDSPDYKEPTQEEIVLQENVLIIEESNLPIPEIRGDTLIFTITDTPPDIKVGDVLVYSGGSNSLNKIQFGGFIRIVTGVIQQGSELIITTIIGTLLDIIQECNIDESYPFTFGEPDNFSNLVLASDSSNNYKVTATLTKGSLILNAGLRFRLTITDGELVFFSLSAFGDAFIETDVEIFATGAFLKNFEKNLIQGPPIATIPVGPVVLTVNLRMVAGIDLAVGAAGLFSTGFDANVQLEVGAKYSEADGWSEIWMPVFSAEGHQPLLEIKAASETRFFFVRN